MKNTVSENGQLNANPIDNSELNSELVEIKEVKGTPFTIIRNDTEWYVTLGKFRLTEKLQNEEEAIKDAKREDWERIMQVIGVMLENYNEDKQNTKNIQTQL